MGYLPDGQRPATVILLEFELEDRPGEVLPVLEQLEPWTYDSIHDALIGLAERLELKNGRIMWPVRPALSGKAVTPGGAVELCQILGKDETLRRIRTGMEKLAQ